MSTELENLRKQLQGQEEEQRGLPVVETKRMHVTVGELRKVVEANPDHPCCAAYAKAIADRSGRPLPSDRRVAVEAVDLEAALDDKEVIRATTMEGGIKTTRKTLGNTREPLGSPAKPAPTVTPPESPAIASPTKPKETTKT